MTDDAGCVQQPMLSGGADPDKVAQPPPAPSQSWGVDHGVAQWGTPQPQEDQRREVCVVDLLVAPATLHRATIRLSTAQAHLLQGTCA